MPLENFGAVFLPEGDGFGAGVRLKFLRRDVRQIVRLEGEGGIVNDDDVPCAKRALFVFDDATF